MEYLLAIIMVLVLAMAADDARKEMEGEQDKDVSNNKKNKHNEH